MQKKIKIFSDIQYLPEGIAPVSIIEPFWNQGNYAQQISDYAGIADSLFEMSSLDDADIAVLPFDWLHIRGNTWKPKVNLSLLHIAFDFAHKVKKSNKPLVVFFSNDSSHEEIQIKNAIVFRQSLLASKRKSNDFAMSAVEEDIVKKYLNNQLITRPKKEKPVIGFMGFANKLGWDIRLKELIYQIAMLHQGGVSYLPYRGHSIRTEVLRYLSQFSGIDTNFVIRDNMVIFNENIGTDEKSRARFEYVENITNSDYILCCRGRGNFSFRFFETLCCGRIPVFINTDCVLPFDFTIDWKKYCVWVDIGDLPYVGEIIIDFHNRLSPAEFIDLQYQCRQLWKDMLSNEGFFTNFWRHFC